MHSSLYVSVLIALPMLGALVAMALRKTPGASYAVAMATGVVEFALTLVLAVLYKTNIPNIPGAAGFDFYTRHVLSAPLGLAYDVALDGLSLLMVVLTALVLVLSLLGGRDRRREPSFVAWLLILTGLTMGSFVSHDVLEFFIFFELTLVPCYFIISGWGGKERNRAALKFFLYTFTASAPLLVGILYLGFAVQHQHPTQGLSFAYGTLMGASISHATAVWLFVAFAVAFGAKSPIWPLHTWSPLTYAEAPTAGSIVLSALLAKLGSYGLLRFAVGLLPLAMTSVRPYVMTLAVIGILYGSILAAVSSELKRFVAYSSLAQMGFITLGVVSGSTIGVTGAVLLMFNHGVITMAFFLMIGFLEKRRMSTQIADFAGLQRPMPVLAALFTVTMLASIGLPGLSGFVSEYLILIGTFTTHAWWSVTAALGVLASAVYLLWAYQRVFHGRAEGANAALEDASSRERWVLVPLIVLIVVLGVFPKPVLDRISPSVHTLVTMVATASVTK